MRTLARIFVGAVVGLVAAIVICIGIIIVTETAIWQRWMDHYDDVQMAMLLWLILMASPIIGGWWAWTRAR